MIKYIKNFFFLFTGKPGVTKKDLSNETLRFILHRRSCRSFTGEEINTDDIKTILEAGRYAPSTVNLQTWSFITFSKNEWHEVFKRPIPFRGTYAIVICADTYRIRKVFPESGDTPFVNLSFAVFNAGLAAMNMTIAAEALGLRSIMLSETGQTGLLDIEHLKDTLQLPDGVLPITTLVLGKSNMTRPGIPPHQPWSSVVMNNCYNLSDKESLKDWWQQMLIGFKLTHPLSTLDKQIDLYKRKMTSAEIAVKKEFLQSRHEDPGRADHRVE
jgi:nitroreductase